MWKQSSCKDFEACHLSVLSIFYLLGETINSLRKEGIVSSFCNSNSTRAVHTARQLSTVGSSLSLDFPLHPSIAGIRINRKVITKLPPLPPLLLAIKCFLFALVSSRAGTVCCQPFNFMCLA